MKLQPIAGGVCAPKGFLAGGLHCGVRKNQEKLDLSMIYSEVPCAVGATYTQNKVKGAPIAVTRRNLADGKAQAMVCNSGNANTCNRNGEAAAQQMCDWAGAALELGPEDVIVASTGVIGQELPLAPIAQGIPRLALQLSREGSSAACAGIMTTDTFQKEFAYAFDLNGVTCKIGAIAKGSGMIHPNMATMLAFVTTDAAITPAALQQAVSKVVEDTFNMVSVDGDTSTNDMLVCMANGLAGNECLEEQSGELEIFTEALFAICKELSQSIARDGEGASKLLTCQVSGAPSKEIAKAVAKSVVTSSLFKAAMFGSDANWGRILCAIGYTEGAFEIEKTDVSLASSKGSIAVCKGGYGTDFSEEEAKRILQDDSIDIRIALNSGMGQATAWGCDLTYDYVKINGDYRS